MTWSRTTAHVRGLRLGAAFAAAPLVLAAATPAAAAPDYEPNKAGNGITQLVLDCPEGEVTLLVNSNRSETGGWGVGRVVGDGVLIPLSFSFSAVAAASDESVEQLEVTSETTVKGNGRTGGKQETVTCSGADVAQLDDAFIAAAPAEFQEQLELLQDEGYDQIIFNFAVTAVPRG